jgi:hypothetical protein
MKTLRELIFEKHRSMESRLEQIRPEELAALASKTRPMRQEIGLLAMVREFWMESIWPWRRAWLAMTAVWLVMLFVFAANHDTPRTARVKVRPPSPEMMAALREQRQMMLQLFEPASSERPTEPRIPGPRSEYRVAIYFT